MREIASEAIRTKPFLEESIALLRFIRILIDVTSQLSNSVSKLAFGSIRAASLLSPLIAQRCFHFEISLAPFGSHLINNAIIVDVVPGKLVDRMRQLLIG